jgi:hypothetical protein
LGNDGTIPILPTLVPDNDPPRVHLFFRSYNFVLQTLYECHMLGETVTSGEV